MIAPVLANQLLGLVFRGESPSLQFGRLYAALHETEPGSVGEAELSGGDYVRQSVRFLPPTLEGVTNGHDLQFDGLPTATLRYLGLWDAPSGGRFVWGLKLDEPRTISQRGDSLRIPAGAIDIAFGGG